MAGRVLSAIAFEGTRENPVFSIRQKLTTNHGMVRILPGAVFSEAHSEGRSVLGTLSFAFADTDEPFGRAVVFKCVVRRSLTDRALDDLLSDLARQVCARDVLGSRLSPFMSSQGESEYGDGG
jgi:hypothetical protein